MGFEKEEIPIVTYFYKCLRRNETAAMSVTYTENMHINTLPLPLELGSSWKLLSWLQSPGPFPEDQVQNGRWLTPRTVLSDPWFLVFTPCSIFPLSVARPHDSLLTNRIWQ